MRVVDEEEGVRFVEGESESLHAFGSRNRYIQVAHCQGATNML
jgi:hypothetical protein